MQRPIGVTILAVLAFVGAGFTVLGALAMFLGGAVLSSLADVPQMRALAGAGGIILGIFFLAWAAFDAFIGIGLLKLQNWARIVTIVLAGLGLFFSAVGLLFSLTHVFGFFFFGLLVRRIIVAAIEVWVIVYLLKPHVKQAFGATGF
jgi:hypothetical protein